jgi:hypothetical protein
MHLALFDRQGWIYDLSVSSRPVTAAPDKPAEILLMGDAVDLQLGYC